MGLPIPDIMEKASNVLISADDLVKWVKEKGACTSVDDVFTRLKSDAEKVGPDDLMAAMAEIGRVYVGMHNIQVRAINLGIDEKNPGKVMLGIMIDFGLGPRNLVTPFSPEDAKKLAGDLLKAASETQGGGGLILE